MENIGNDYEIRHLINAYRRGELDAGGLKLLDEALAEYGLERRDVL